MNEKFIKDDKIYYSISYYQNPIKLDIYKCIGIWDCKKVWIHDNTINNEAVYGLEIFDTVKRTVELLKQNKGFYQFWLQPNTNYTYPIYDEESNKTVHFSTIFYGDNNEKRLLATLVNNKY